MKTTRRIARALPVIALGGAALMSTAVPAHASDSGWVYNANKAGKGRFIDSGNKLEACDIKTDGKSAFLWIENYNGSRQAYVHDNYNNGKCTTWTSPLVLESATHYWIQVCIGNSSTSPTVLCGKNWYDVYNSH